MIKILKINDEGEILGYEDNEVTAIPAFKALWSLNYNKQKGDVDGRKRERAKSELLYLYLLHDPRSPYVNYNEKERNEEALRDSLLPLDWTPSEEWKEVKKKYVDCIETRFYKVLKAAEKALDQVREFLETVDLTSPDSKVTPRDITTIITDLPKVSTSLRQLQDQARYTLTSPDQSKGDHEIGWLALKSNDTGYTKGSKGEVQQGTTEE